MYFKALELQGFKSFPEKTVLTFGEDITGIVGPNGSGKSNISDAIRWVMGEQSTRELRSGRMEDVIFGGTQTRAPLGFAEVSLIIDNTEHVLPMDEAEVMVTRRYYRSGESEFYINRKSVRLKDINELFMDTGMGREGYSVIGQGKIDEIISARSEDRRQVFESAAGIARFRRRKEEAERKIANTDANLLRISDKVSELELQVEPLRIQSEKAQKYIVLRDQLKTLEVSLWADSLDALRAAAEKADGDYAAAQAQLDAANRRQEQLYADAEALAGRMRDHDVHAEERRRELSDLEALESDLEREAALTQVNIENNRETLRRLDEDREEQLSRRAALEEQIAEQNARLAAIGERREALKAQSGETMARAEANAAAGGDLETGIAALRARQEKLRGELESANVRLSALDAAAAEMAGGAGQGDDGQELESARQAAEEVRIALEQALADRESTENTLRGFTLRLENREKRRAALEKEVSDFRLEQGAMASRVKLLSDMEREYEGYSRSVRTVMQESGRGRLKGVHGPLANLVRTDREYAVAVETALGGAAQNIVVDSDGDAKTAINALKRMDAGRATFLPLNVIRGKKLTEDFSGSRGYVGIASELCRYDAKYTDIVRNFLGRTLVTETLDDAAALGRACSHRYRVVSLDGQVVNAGGSMTGGSLARNVGILSRAEELERLRGEQKTLDGKLTEKERELDEAVRQVQSTAYEMETAQGEKRALDDSVLRLESEREHRQERLAALESAAADALRAREELEKRVAANRAEAESIAAGAAETREKLERSTAELEEKTRGREDLRAQGDELVTALADLAREDAALQAERSTLERAAEQLTALLREAEAAGEDREKSAEACRTREEELTAQLNDRRERLAEITAECEARREEARALTNLRLEMEAERTRRDKELQEAGKDVVDLSHECARLEQKKVSADLEEQQILEKLWDTYELNYSTLAPIRVQLESTAGARRDVADLKRKISALGSPNLDAIDEYQRVSERYDYLMSQRDDVQRAKDELEKIISDIVKQMKEIFTEQFALINRHFSETFVEMFGGGKASLELEDEEDILGCDIAIKVQPPGKTLKNISLLSGGEKAFTAIALYFAMLKVRPTPFCVIDEIDASLDEPNVVRFSEYLRRMSEKTQFIVITHRRSTMEGADVLYGVTMQQKGVSKMLTINLSDAEQEFLTQE